MASYVTTFDDPAKKVRLSEISTEPPKGITRADADGQLAELGSELFELQDLLWGARTHSVLIVLQGMDTAGKDGAIKHVAGFLNPRGVSVVSFGVPTPEELAHDFLWRVHQRTPRLGEWTLFNRSHYEDVLVVRVNQLVPEPVWKERYGHIRDFEELLSEHNTIVLKFFLHISKDEQKKRLLAREEEERAAWKLSVGDWQTREQWDEYQDAYEDAIRRCASEHAPWHVVPANAKWFRNLAIASTVVDALKPYKKAWRKKLDDMGDKARAELAVYRKGKKGGNGDKRDKESDG
jgi:PPK2 family polyphosphate:nucleotide phosphotransferase